MRLALALTAAFYLAVAAWFAVGYVLVIFASTPLLAVLVVFIAAMAKQAQRPYVLETAQ